MNKKFSVIINKKIKKFNKTIKIPGDKSCSIRALLFASQCIGISKIKNLLESIEYLVDFAHFALSSASGDRIVIHNSEAG